MEFSHHTSCSERSKFLFEPLLPQSPCTLFTQTQTQPSRPRISPDLQQRQTWRSSSGSEWSPPWSRASEAHPWTELESPLDSGLGSADASPSWMHPWCRRDAGREEECLPSSLLQQSILNSPSEKLKLLWKNWSCWYDEIQLCGWTSQQTESEIGWLKTKLPAFLHMTGVRKGQNYWKLLQHKV